MIRLIATDLDGTLLYPDSKLPDDIFETIHALSALGIRFAAASGRQFINLRHLFAPVADQMAFVCENGALVADGREVLGVTAIPRDTALAIVDDLKAAGMDLLISGRHSCYLTPENKPYTDNMVYRLRNTVTIIDDAHEITEDIIKVSGHIEGGIAHVADALLAKWGHRLTATVSGRDWLDFTLSNKGTGLQMLLDRLDISAADTVAFGDQFNDESMLDLVGHPFLMAHAKERLYKPRYQLCERVMPVLRQIIQNGGEL